MRELTVYYCQQCGYYGYYQLPRNAVCPKCNEKMTMLQTCYQEFMDLDCEERDELLSKEMIEHTSSVVQRLILPHKKYNSRETIALLGNRIKELEAENKKLNDTVTWMHKTIWDLLRRNKQLEKSKNEIQP